MDKSRYYLGIDNGGTLSKAALFDSKGKEVAQANKKTELLMPRPGFTERNMVEMWEATASVIEEVIRSSGVPPQEIAAVAATGHGNGLYLVDHDGKPSRNGIISTDSRALSFVKKWESEGILDSVLPKTMQSVWAGSAVSLLAWLAENEPETLKRSAHILMAKDYIRYMLCGKIDAEITDMSGTNLMNVRDVKYDRDLLAAFGLEAMMDKLSPIVGSTEICGGVTREAAEKTGLIEGTPVAAGLFDIDAMAMATGVVDDSKLSIVAGTWSVNQYISRQPVVKKGLFMTSLYCINGYWLVCEASPTSASNLEWFVTQFIDKDEASRATKGGDVFDYVESLVSATRAEESSIVFLPFIFGSNVIEDAKCAFVGLSGWHTKSHMIRAIYEGVAFGHRYHLARLAAVGKLPTTVRMAGGATKSRFWMQLFADVLQMPLEVTTSTELGALGAAICAMVGSGDRPSVAEAALSMVQIGATYQPDPGKRAIYEKKYQGYLATIEALSALWKSLG
jgi:L-xylulokinase